MPHTDVLSSSDKEQLIETQNGVNKIEENIVQLNVSLVFCFFANFSKLIASIQ